MPRTDENDRELHVVLTYLANKNVSAKQIYGALGIARNTYHNRIHEDSYPNAEEIRLVAEGLGLNPVVLMLRFGLVTPEHIQECLDERVNPKV